MDANVEEQTVPTFVDYLKHYYVVWPKITDRSFDAHLREYFAEWPDFTSWRC
jgi:hypothetical protein